MSFLDYFKSLKPEHRVAWAVAIAADALQIAALPLFAEGAVSPADSLLDLIVAFVMIRLLGWHWAFLPSVGGETHPRRRSVSNLDRRRMVCHPPASQLCQPAIPFRPTERPRAEILPTRPRARTTPEDRHAVSTSAVNIECLSDS